jgi:peptide/nickel transport system permease protein
MRKILKGNISLIAGLSMISFTFFLLILSYIWTPFDPLEVDPKASFAGVSATHILGADNFGRDILSQIIVGSRVTLLVAALSVTIAMSLGVSIGLAIAVAKRTYQSPMIYAVNIALAFPAALLAIILAAVYGASTVTAVTAIGIATAAAVAQVTRRTAAGILASDFVLAAHASGSGTWWIVRKHLLPNLRASLLIQASAAVSISVLAESSLSYLGLGTPPPAPSWGRMLANSQQYLFVNPLLAIWPGIVIVIVVLGFNLLGDGVREAFDPTLRRSEQ